MRRALGLVFVTTVCAFASPCAEAKLAEVLVTDTGVVKPIDLDQARIAAAFDRTSGLVTYDLTFTARQVNATEGTFYFALPRQAYVHEFGMWIDGRYQGSAIVEAKAGRVAYESIVRRGVDPALLEWTAGNTFKMRVFPLSSGRPTRIKLTIAMPAELIGNAATFQFPMNLGKVPKLEVDVHGFAAAKDVPEMKGLKALKLEEVDDDDGITEFKGHYEAKAILPPDDVTIAFKTESPATVRVRRADGEEQRFFEASVYPSLPEAKRDASAKAVILWDYSLSEEEHQATRLEALAKYLAARKPASVDVYGFNQRVFALKSGLKPSDVKAVITAQPYDGGTRLDQLANMLPAIVAKDAKITTDLVLFTNGVDSYELFDFKHMKGMRRKNLNAFILAPSNGANAALLQAFAGALDGVVLNEEGPLRIRSFLARPWRVAKIAGSKSLVDLERGSDAAIFPKDGLVVRGKVKKTGKGEIAVTFAQGRTTKVQKYKLDTDTDVEEATIVPRLWAQTRINRLLPEKRAQAAQIKNLALTHQLMSPYTSMAVLEFCEDYAEFKIEAPKDCQPRMNSDFAEDGGDMLSEGAGDDDEEGNSADAVADGAASEAAPATAAADAAQGDDLFADVDVPDWEPQGSSAKSAEDTVAREYGFEKILSLREKAGAPALYAEYLKQRALFRKIPYFYVYAAGLFRAQKQEALADLVLSNVVETRPGDARWLRIYAYSLIAWGKAKDAVPLYRAIAELREEDPQSHRDFGLALEAIGQPIAAMRLFETVYSGKWDDRLEGMREVIRHDLARAALATLKTAGLTPDNRAKAEKFAKVDASLNDKIVATVSWDTDNTDVDLHVIEPTGAHVFYGDKAPNGAVGQLSFDARQGYGPEQYRASVPVQGNYRFYLTYFSQNRQALQDGTFVRVDFRITERGIERKETRTLFLKDQGEVRTVVELTYRDPAAPLPPPNYGNSMAMAKDHLKGKRWREARAALEAIGARRDPQEEAARLFHLARVDLAERKFTDAQQRNQRALALDPKLIAAQYNNACAAALAQNKAQAIQYLNLLADSLESRVDQRAYFLGIMRNDADLTFVRGTSEFRAVTERINVGH